MATLEATISIDIDVLEPCDLLDHPSRAENSYHVANGSGTDATTIMNGLIITGGNANLMYPTGPLHRPHETGGGMYNKCGSPILINCTFVMNSAGHSGGGMENTADNPTWPFPQPPLCSPGTPTLTNCTFSNNSAYYGGAMLNVYSNPTLTNCTFSGNWASSGGGMLNAYNSPTLTNCILWGNDGGEITGNGANITYSNIQGGWPGEGNIDANPCFVDSNNNDYHLLPDSPCIDAGNPNYVPRPNETDLDGNPRLLDGNNDGIPVIDMGAYEYECSPPVPAEVRIVPRTINLASKGKWIAAFLWLPEGYDVTEIADIDSHNILLEYEIEPEQFFVDEEKQVVTARFSREKVQPILEVGDIELTISVQLTDGTVFEGTNVVKVIDKDKGGGKFAELGEAINPNPADGATNVSLYTAYLSWTSGSGATSHDVYFGTTSPGMFQGNQSGTTFDPGTMAYYTTYYWRIDEVNKWGKTTGTVWRFTTFRPPPGGGGP